MYSWNVIEWPKNKIKIKSDALRSRSMILHISIFKAKMKKKIITEEKRRV